MTNRIDTPAKRRKLEPQREPYWQKITQGRFVGFRKLETGGTWIARLGKKQRRIGSEEDFTYREAMDAAIQWQDSAKVVGTGRYTVASAINAYIRYQTIERNSKGARAYESRLYRHVPESLMGTELSDLTLDRLMSWRDGLIIDSDDPEKSRKSKATANRVLAMLKASLNLAYRHQKVSTDRAWKALTPFKNVHRPRDLFLTDEQVSRLLKAAEGAFKDMCRAAILTGARYGELCAANVSDLDVINGSLKLTGKTGTRDCFLSSEALVFFKQQAQGKLPNAPLLTTDKGERWKRNHPQRWMALAKKKARLPRETVFYSLRHYYISKALLAGVNIMVVSQNVGTSVAMVEKTYGKFRQKDRRAMLDLVELGK